MPTLTREQRRALLDLLASLPNIGDVATRRLLLADLPGALQAGLPLGNAPAVDLANLVGTVSGEAWATLPDGTVSVRVVVENAVDMVRGSALAGELQAWLRGVDAAGSGPGADAAVAPAPPGPPPRPAPAPPVRIGPLTGAQRRDLLTALLEAFRSQAALAEMVRLGLDENLAAIAGGDNLRSTVFNLIEWAESRGKLAALIQAALDANPGGAPLQAFGAQVGLAADPAAAATPAAHSTTADPGPPARGGIAFYGPTTITGAVVGGGVQSMTLGDIQAAGGGPSGAGSPTPASASAATPAATPPATAAPTPPAGTGAGDTFRYDAFISYSHVDRAWVKSTLLPRLEREGFRVCIDYRDFEIGAPSLVNIENAIQGSRKTLLVITQAWLDSQWTDFESLLVQTDDPAARRRRILPLRLVDVPLPARLRILTYLDLTDPDEIETQLGRLVTAIRAAPG